MIPHSGSLGPNVAENVPKITLSRAALPALTPDNVPMRSSVRHLSRQIVPTIALLAVLVAPSYARAGGGHSVKVESSLAAAVDQLTAGAGPAAPLHVLVYGSNLASVNTAFGLTPRNDLDVVGGESVTVPAATVDKLAAQSGVSYVAIDRPVVPTDTGTASVSADALATLFPSVDGAVSAWAGGFTGAGVGIAIVDSGVTPRADFGTRLVQVQLPAQDGTKLDDGVGHGSFVAGVAAGASPNGKYLGVAPGATVYAVNVAKADGVYTSDVIAGLRWVLQHAKQSNIRIVNLSLSQTSPSQYTASTLDAAVEQLWKAGIVVVVSSGNLGADSMLYAPGNDPFAITVGASDTNDTATTADDTLTAWSSYGTTQSGAVKPELVAPGRHIVSTVPGGSSLAQQAPAANVVENGPAGTYLRMNGTSFSAPQVAGAVALLLQQKPSLTPDQVKWILSQSARPLAGSTAGALDLAAAAGLLATPGAANQGIPYSSWARPGAGTMEFVNAVSAAIRAGAYEKAAAVWTRQATSACATALDPSLKQIKARAYWLRGAEAWERAAQSWDAAADAWGDASLPENASTASKNAGDAWKAAGDAWQSALVPDRSMASWDRAMASWDRMASWDKMASWDRMASWDKMASWDRMASWDALEAWN